MREIKKIAIAGAGGIGGFVVENLINYGYERDQFPITTWQVDLYDDDQVDVKNLLHQNFTESDLGKNKAKIFAERSCGVVTAVDRFMTKKDFADYDVIFCCVDSSDFRRDLYTFWLDAKNKGDLKYFIDGRCSSRNIVLIDAEAGEDMLRKNIITEDVRTGCLRPFEKDNNISHVTPRIIAGMVTQCFMNWLRGETTQSRITRI
jgi:molybdopterin/thiamine biosynthesis adenylyltransferase